jgi:hypothetical protein
MNYGVAQAVDTEPELVALAFAMRSEDCIIEVASMFYWALPLLKTLKISISYHGFLEESVLIKAMNWKAFVFLDAIVMLNCPYL